MALYRQGPAYKTPFSFCLSRANFVFARLVDPISSFLHRTRAEAIASIQTAIPTASIKTTRNHNLPPTISSIPICRFMPLTCQNISISEKASCVRTATMLVDKRRHYASEITVKMCTVMFRHHMGFSCSQYSPDKGG